MGRLTALLVLLWLAGCGGPRQGGPREWTLMFYFAADNNLEAAEVRDLQELLQVGSTDQVQLTAFADRSEKGDDDGPGYSSHRFVNLGNWYGAHWLDIGKGRLTSLGREKQVNMADGAVLKRFVQRSVEKFPARHYMLVISDHGAGRWGLVEDSADDADLLTLPELDAALKQAPKLDILVLDACLMGSYEVATQVQSRTDWLIASEEAVPGVGLRYQEPLQKLLYDPAINGETLGRSLLDAYSRHFEDTADAEASTMALIDLSKLPALAEALSRLAKALAKEGTDWKKVAEIRGRAEEYGADLEDSRFSYQARDLVHVGNLLKDLPGLEQHAKDVVAACRAAVVDVFHGRASPQANGMSIFFPDDRELLEFKEPYPKGAWRDILVQFTEEVGVKNSLKLADLKASAALTRGEEIKVTATISPILALASCELTVLREGWTVARYICGPDENGRLEADFSGYMPSLTDGSGSSGIFCSLGGDDQLTTVTAQWQRGTSAWQDVTIYAVLNMLFGGSSLDHVEKGGKPLHLKPGDRLRVEEVRPDGRRRPGPTLTLRDPSSLQVSIQRLPPGRYEIGFDARSHTGQHQFKTVPVEVVADPQE